MREDASALSDRRPESPRPVTPLPFFEVILRVFESSCFTTPFDAWNHRSGLTPGPTTNRRLHR